MSGHSKWAQIKRSKGVKDIKRGAAFTKLSNAITLAVKQGGDIADPDQNFKLRLTIDAAKVANMPKETIMRAIERASAKQAGEIAEAVYEGFGPGGISVIVEAATDNKNRTTGEIKNLFDKNGANFAQPGSVSYQFQQTGQVIIDRDTVSIDDVFLQAADCGALDMVEGEGNEVLIYTSPADVAKVRQALSEKGFAIKDAAIIFKPLTPMQIEDEETAKKIIDFINKLEDLDDVQRVYTNAIL